MPVNSVSDTARWVAYYRALETRRPDAIFHDPFAERLAGPEGEAIVQELPDGRKMAPPLIVRTAVFDEVITDRIRNHGADLVLNLAAGLDARPWRLPLPPALHWIDADLPGILAYKASIMESVTPACHYEAVAVDLTNPAERDPFFARIGAAHRRVLVVTEGLVIYLTPDQVTALGRALHAQPSFSWWLLDFVTPRILKMVTKSHGPALRHAPFRFGPAEGTAFFHASGWHEDAFFSGIDSGKRLRREMRMAPLWRFIGRFLSAKRVEEFRRMSGVALLARDP